MPPPTSKIWNYFTKKSNNIASCKQCFKIVKFCGNTSNLIKHAKIHGITIQRKKVCTSPPSSQNRNGTDTDTGTATQKSFSSTDNISSTSAIKEENSNPPTTMHQLAPTTRATTSKQNSLPDTFASITTNQEGGTRYNKIVIAVLFFICKDMRPFYVVEGEGFLKLMREIVPNFKVPSANYFKKKLNEKYDVAVDKFIIKLKKIENMCLTADIWTDTMNEKSFMGVTAHYLENNIMKMCYLATRPLNNKHTAEYISENLLNILNEWEIPTSKVRAVITDNANSMLAAIRISLGEKKHLPCFAHTINLVVEEALKLQSVKTIISKVREIVKWIKNSVVQSDKLRKIQMRNNVTEGSVLKLILDVRTRWNSVFYMLERFLTLKKVVSEIVLESVTAPDMPNSIEMDILNQLTALLKPFEYVTKDASGQKYITISKIIPMLNCLTSQIANFTTDSKIVQEFKNVLNRELKRRYGQIEFNDHAALATLLDPRFKNLHFQDASACGRAIQKLKQIVAGESNRESTSGSEEDSVSNSNTNTYDFWKYHKELAHGQKKKKPGSRCEEVSLYLSNPVIPLRNNPFAEWDDMKLIYPMLHKHALQYLIVVATSVPCESLFSKAGATVSQARNRLSPKYLEKLLFLGNLDKEEFFS